MAWVMFERWLSRTDLFLLALILFALMCAAATAGYVLHHRARPSGAEEDEGHGYIVSAVLGLLALLLGFTFSLAVDRFDARRVLVLEEANAIGTAYLRAQLLEEPHRTRTSELLVRYTDNRIALAKARPGSAAQGQLLARNDALITDIWAATSAAFTTIQELDFSSAYLNSINQVIDLDASRKTARAARVPAEVFAVLFIYLITTAGVLGYVLKGPRSRISAGFLLALLTLSLMLILDIDRPVAGGISESQQPMEALRKSFAQPPSVFDKWRLGGA